MTAVIKLNCAQREGHAASLGRRDKEAKDRQRTCTVTMRRVCATVVVVEKQEMLHLKCTGPCIL